MNNEMKVTFKALNENESFARVCVASFCAVLNPNIDELSDIKTAVSEAVTNAIVHAYPDKNKVGDVEIGVKLQANTIYITVTDYGIGIQDVNQAMQPFYTSKPDCERSGIGFTVMEGFMDKLQVKSVVGRGTVVSMCKTLANVEEKIGG